MRNYQQLLLGRFSLLCSREGPVRLGWLVLLYSQLLEGLGLFPLGLGHP